MKTTIAEPPYPLRSTRLLCTFASILAAAIVLSAPLAWAAQPLPRDGLIMHLESHVGVEANRGTIKYWWDQSGYGQDLRGAGSLKLVDNVLNGLPVIELDSASDKLRQFRPSNLPTHSNDRTVFVLSAPSNVGAQIGYGASNCASRFVLQHDADGYSGLSTGCTGSVMHAQEQLAPGQWRLNTSVLSNGTLFHLRDGELVDGRTRNFRTQSGPLLVELTDAANTSKKAVINGQRLRIAAILVYNWALNPNELRKVHRYLGETYFNSQNRFGRPARLSAARLPAPQMSLTNTLTSQNELQLDWRVSFADECGAANGWTRSRATSGSQRIRQFSTGDSYAMNCWHAGASASADFTLDLLPLRVSWQPAEGPVANTGYKLFLGARSKRYDRIIRLPRNTDHSHVLAVPAGTYYVAMSTLGPQGRESSLSSEMAITVR